MIGAYLASSDFTKSAASFGPRPGVGSPPPRNPELIKIFMDHTPLGRAGKPEDIVGPAIFLASDMAAYVNGTIVMADGGSGQFE